MIFNGTNLESGVILTGLLQALEGLSEMVMIAISLIEVAKVAGVTGLEVSTWFFLEKYLLGIHQALDT